MRLLAIIAAALLPVAPIAPLAAQEHDHAGGHDIHGHVTFATSCAAPAHAEFIRGLALLHSFWFSEAGTAFDAAFRADSGCAMAQWGLAMTFIGNPVAAPPSPGNLAAGAAAAALASRAAAAGPATARERDFVTAVATFYAGRDSLPHGRRMGNYSRAMEQVASRYADDPEAAIFHALSLVATASPTDTTLANQRRAAGRLNPLFRRYPDHPGLAHYIIHANDATVLANLGLDAARRYARIAPAVPHAQHMPSHIFIRLGLWDENIAANRRSYDAGVAHSTSQGQHGLAYHEFHAMDYMVYGYLQLGRDSAALRVVREADTATVLTVQSAANPFAMEYGRNAMAARYAIERGRWDEAARLPVRAGRNVAAEGITRFARAVGAARSGEVAAAREEAAQLARIRDSLQGINDSYWARVMTIKRQAVEAWLALATGDTARALSEAAAAADVEDVTAKNPVTPAEIISARELQADLLLQLGRHADARAAYETVLRHEPNRARALFALARAAEGMGDRRAAQARYQEYLRLMARAEAPREEIALARRAVRR